MKRLMLKLWLYFCQKYDFPIKAKCGHWASAKVDLIGCGGEAFSMKLDFVQGIPELCHLCKASAVVPCAFCNEPILPGDRIFTFNVPNCSPLCLVGCNYCDCKYEAEEYGVWTTKGVRIHKGPLFISRTNK